MRQELIKKCKNLDRKAQREMVDHLSPLLFPICRRYANSFEDAKDLLQEALIMIFNSIDKCKANEVIPFKSWCKRIAINNALGKIRKNAKEGEQVSMNANEACKKPTVYSKLNMEDILKLLDLLPERHKIVFNLSILDGYTHKEISDVMGIKESSSRTLLVRARQALQEMILSDTVPIEVMRNEALEK